MSATEEKELGAKAWKDGDFNKAIDHFTKAIVLATDVETQKILYSNRSAAYLKIKQNILALSDANKCIELDQKWTKGYARKGDALYAEKKYADAYNAYNSGLRIDSRDSVLNDKANQAMNAIASQSSTSSGRGWASEGQGSGWGASSNSSAASNLPADLPGTLGKVQTYGRYFMIINAILYLLPMGYGFSMGCYRRAMMAAIAGYVIGLYGRHGMPKLSMDYAQRIMPDASFMSLFLAVLLIMQRPYFIALASLVLLEFRFVSAQAFGYARTALPSMTGQLNAMIARFAPQLAGQDLTGLFSASKVNVFNAQLVKMSALLEVTQGIFLILEILLPTRNIMFTFLWWQYLQMRFMIDSTGTVREAFAEADRRISSITNHNLCPKVVGKGYAFIKEKMAQQVQRPAPGEAPSAPSLSGMLSKCTVM